MFDDESRPDPYNLRSPDDEPPRGSRLRSCLFLSITFLLILSLAGSSLLAYFLLDRSSRSRSNLGANLALEDEAALVGPTAAPATVAALTASEPVVEAVVELTPPALEVNRIAIINGDGQIETMSPNGEDRRVLTRASDDAIFQFPAWAPDSRRLAVVGEGFGGGAIYVLDDVVRTEGTLDERQVYFSADNTPFYLYWSPDSRNLAFLANHSRNTMGLSVVAGDGTDDSRLLATGAPFYWDWSDNSRQLLIHSGRPAADTLALIDLNGETQSGNLATPGYFQAPGIGAGGRYWAFAEDSEDGLSTLVVVDAQSGERESFEQAGSLALSWSPVRDFIAFTNGAVDQHPFWGPLRLLDVATGELRTLTTQTVLAFFWSPDGRSIAFITLGRDRDDDSVYAASPQKSRLSSRLDTVPSQQFGEGFLTLSVIDVETGQGLRLLDFVPTASYLTQFLPFFDQYALSHQVWSPDGRALVLPVWEDETNVILVIPTRGGRPYQLAEGEIAFWSQK
jgi:TolB protein